MVSQISNHTASTTELQAGPKLLNHSFNIFIQDDDYHHLSLRLLQKFPIWFSCFHSTEKLFLKQKSGHITTLPTIPQTLPITLRINYEVLGLQSCASISDLILCHLPLVHGAPSSCTGMLPSLCTCLTYCTEGLCTCCFPQLQWLPLLPSHGWLLVIWVRA